MIESIWNGGLTELGIHTILIGLLLMFCCDAFWTRIVRVRNSRLLAGLVKEVSDMEEEVTAVKEWAKDFYEYITQSK